MFGYIKAYPPEMRVKEYDTYKAIYCGLCKQLGKKFGPWARFTLSYDFTFFAILALELEHTPPDFEKISCPMKPLKKCVAAKESSVLATTANFAMIMLYYKTLDNIHDPDVKDKIKSRLALPLVKRAYRKASAENPEMAAIAKEMFAAQQRVEATDSPLVDEACEPSATALGKILTLYTEHPAQKRVAERLGYLLGRTIYLCDVLDDLEDDLKSGSYNPVLNNYRLQTGNSAVDLDSELFQSLKSQAFFALNHTISEAATTSELLELTMFGGIIHNILYDGLVVTAEEIFKKGSTQDERPI